MAAHATTASRTGAVVKWNGEAYVKTVREVMKQRLIEVGQHLVEKTKANISVPNPPHSRPGEFPRLIKGDLQRGTFYRTDLRELRVQVDNVVAYALWLELEAGRSFMRRTLIEEKPAIRRIMIRPIGDAQFKKGHFTVEKRPIKGGVG